ncbi:MAG TPA: UbiH/UbiF family hydroxylase [Burkholderiales bacterium]|nr:UbiH/UbiF family hydroxylase [Burkholderiales bacterium]
MNFDVVVVGAGLVGTCFARAARGMSLALVGQAPGGAAVATAGIFDSRVYALTPANVALLRALKVWQTMPAERLTPVHAMRVYGDDGSSVLEFDAYEAGVPELAWIVEDAPLQVALWRGLDVRDQVEFFGGGECERLEPADGHLAVALRGGRILRARLVVGADGAHSFVRAQAGIAVRERPYGQTAVVANFACERPHRNVAYQWFQGGPVLALLPLPGSHVSMVWSLPDAEAARVLALAPAELAREVEVASRRALGELTVVGAPRGFALRRVTARRMVGERIALMGDAAHVVHPLAGQGANLGFQDAAELARVLAAREPVRDPGDPRLLRRYERARAEPVLAMDLTVHGLYRLFQARGGAVARLRNAGLNLTNHLAVLKNILMRQAMG